MKRKIYNELVRWKTEKDGIVYLPLYMTPML